MKREAIELTSGDIVPLDKIDALIRKPHSFGDDTWQIHTVGGYYFDLSPEDVGRLKMKFSVAHPEE